MAQVSDTVANNANDSYETTVGASPLLRLYTGEMPANCAAAATGTKVAEMVLPSDWLTTSSARSKSKNGTWSGSGIAPGGYAGYYRIYESTGTTCHEQGVLGETWAQSKAYVVGQHYVANGNAYRVTAAGTSAASGTGPSGAGGSITDGGVTVAYIAAADMTIDNSNIAGGQVVAVTAFTKSYPANA